MLREATACVCNTPALCAWTEEEGRVHSEVIPAAIPQLREKAGEPALSGLKRDTGGMALCYCVDRLLDTHNPFGDKYADRGE